MDFREYIEFLNKLLSYGPKIGPVLEQIQGLVEDAMVRIENIQKIVGISPRLRSADATEEVMDLEEQVLSAALGGRMAGPLDEIRKVLDFVRTNPEIIKFIMLFL